jgi:hypothetical protein
MATFQLYWWRKISVAFLYIISGTNRHLRRTNEVPLASWIALKYVLTE